VRLPPLVAGREPSRRLLAKRPRASSSSIEVHEADGIAASGWRNPPTDTPTGCRCVAAGYWREFIRQVIEMRVPTGGPLIA
jgi:hypothetical protein